MLVHLAGSDVVVFAQADIEITLVVSKIQVRLSAIIQDVHLTWTNERKKASSEIRCHAPCSVGAIVPASMFMYGSILMAVTFKPVVLSRSPVLDADHCQLEVRYTYRSKAWLRHLPMTPFPIPLRSMSGRTSYRGRLDIRDDTSTDKDVFDHGDRRSSGGRSMKCDS